VSRRTPPLFSSFAGVQEMSANLKTRSVLYQARVAALTIAAATAIANEVNMDDLLSIAQDIEMSNLSKLNALRHA